MTFTYPDFDRLASRQHKKAAAARHMLQGPAAPFGNLLYAGRHAYRTLMRPQTALCSSLMLTGGHVDGPAALSLAHSTACHFQAKFDLGQMPGTMQLLL